MNANTQFLREMESVHWFAQCGSPLISFQEPFELVGSWREAQESYLDPKWEEFSLDARNELTIYLARHCSVAFQNWNEIVKEATPFVESNILSHAKKTQQENGLHPRFVDCVKWDVLSAISAASYTQFNPPQFYLRYFEVYRRGHFPCGWEGVWPKGKMLIY